MISCISPAAIVTQLLMIDVAAAVGVRRFVPSEWGTDTDDPDMMRRMEFFGAKGEVLARLREFAERGGMQWTAVVPGAWWDVCLESGEMGFDVGARKAVLYDGGNRVIEGTTVVGVARAVRGLVMNPVVGVNEFVYVTGLSATQREVLAALESATGEKWTVEEASAKEREQKGRDRVAKGDLEGAVDVIWGVAYGTGLGLQLRGRKLSNEAVGLEAESLDGLVKNILGVP